MKTRDLNLSSVLNPYYLILYNKLNLTTKDRYDDL